MLEGITKRYAIKFRDSIHFVQRSPARSSQMSPDRRAAVNRSASIRLIKSLSYQSTHFVRTTLPNFEFNSDNSIVPQVKDAILARCHGAIVA